MPWRAATASRPCPICVRIQRSGQADRAQGRALNGAPSAANACFRNPWSKRALCRRHAIGEALANFGRHRENVGAPRDHGVRDAGERLDRRRDGHFRVHQRAPLVTRARRPAAASHRTDHADLGDAVTRRVRAVVSRSTMAIDGAKSCMARSGWAGS
jgi:hypothetical protein